VLSFSRNAPKFQERDCQILGVSVDSHFVHKAWVENKAEEGGLGGDLAYPLLADINKTMAADYGVLNEDAGVALRGLFLIDPEGTVMHATINNLSVGRSAAETLRTLKAFQYVASHEGEVCPADWDEGADTMAANPEGMRDYLKSH
jgi:peroxiredoxin (alkyl hydroperoxide reductase subunit C)